MSALLFQAFLCFHGNPTAQWVVHREDIRKTRENVKSVFSFVSYSVDAKNGNNV